MATLQQLQPHIAYRLALAHSIFKKAVDFCKIQSDLYGFSHGLIALHDALDNFTGAIASQLNIALPQESKLLTAVNLIQEHERQSDKSFQIISRNEVVFLNTIRNNIKHQGLMPNIAQARGLIGPITLFFQEYCRRYFSLEWDLVSIADLILDQKIKGDIKSIEVLINRGEYKDALTELAIIKFKVFEERSLRIKLDSSYDLEPISEDRKELRESTNIFPKHKMDGLSSLFFDVFDRTDLLEKGIDHGFMAKFEQLTAKVGFNNNREWKYVLDHGHNWASPNWTKDNALFCYDFLVDAIIKNQRKVYAFSEQWISTDYYIRAADEISIYNNRDELIYTLSKGEERNTMIFGRIDNQWEIFSPSDCTIKITRKEDEEEDIIGFFKETDKDKFIFLKTEQFVRNKDNDGLTQIS